MSIVFAFLTVGFLLAIPVLFVILIINAIRRKPVKKIGWSMLGCFIGIIASAMIFSEVDPQSNCEHEFVEIENISATCLDDGRVVQQCPKCEKEIEELIFAAGHNWREADCETPKTCEMCGSTEGGIGGHKWIEATCTTPRMCSTCELKEGEPLSSNMEHTWSEATCTNPQTCSVCGVEEGTVLEHTEGDWETIKEATSAESGTRQKVCVVCKKVLETETYDSPAKEVVEIVEAVVTKYSATTRDLEGIQGEADNSVVITGAIYCENREQKVKEILSAIADELQNTEANAECVFVIGDIEDGEDGDCLAMASIDTEGNYEIAPMSVEFKTERNEWISAQFSAWDGSHTVLKDIIKDNLNDEKSFEHIETTYVDVISEEKKNQVNNILSEAGYSQRVDIGDLFVITEFSAKNAFNATVKNTAFGIVDQSEDLVTLIAIE